MGPVKLLALLGTLVLASAASSQQDSGETEAPVVMRVAYATYDGAGGEEAGRRLQWLGSVLRDVARRAESAGFERPLEFSIHWANPYQAYEWLRRGHVDAALVTPLIGALLVPKREPGEAPSDFAILADLRKKRGTADHGVWLWVRKRPGPDGELVPATERRPIEALHETFGLALECADRLEEDPAPSCIEEKPPRSCMELRKRRVHAYSHLTPAFLAPIAEADRWLRDEIGDDDRERSAGFWRQLRTLLELHPVPGSYEEPAGIEFRLSYSDKDGRERLPDPSTIPNDVLVVRRSFVAEFLDLKGGASARRSGKGGLEHRIQELATALHEARAPASELCEPSNHVDLGPHDAKAFEPFRCWVDELRRRPGIGPVLSDLYLHGDYAFTIPEIAELLLQDQINSQEQDLALVLPGGGVKAAYQAELIDRLYDSHLLNSRESWRAVAKRPKRTRSGGCDTPKREASDADGNGGRGDGEGAAGPRLHVRRVIGTSGGAITGIFAALHPPPGGGERSQRRHSLAGLWRDPDQVSEEKIFAGFETPRWAGVIATLVIFALIVVAGGRCKRLASHSAPEGRAADWRLLLVCGGLILLFPWILKLVPWILELQDRAGQLGRELWPDALLFAWLVFFAYGALSLVRVERPPSSIPGTPQLPTWVVGTAAAVTLSLPLLAAFAERGPASTQALALALALEMSVVAAAIAFAWWEARRPDRWVHDPWRFIAAAGVLGTVIVLTHLGLLALRWLSSEFSLVEVTRVYWLGLVGLAAASSVLCLWLGPGLRWFQTGVTYLCESQAHRTWNGRRVVGLAVLGILGFGYWNFLIVPGLYGTQRPLAALQANLTAYGAKSDGIRHYELETDLILTAATLEQIGAIGPGDLYFCIRGPGQCAYPVESERTSRRWLVQSASADLLEHLVVASGAAFPVFAPHRVIGVQVPASPDPGPDPAAAPREGYYLIDGGYGHNVPIEAAGLAGSRQVLVVHSSPRIDRRELGPEKTPTAGQLVHYLRRIPGFLFERSQMLDLHARARLVVASLAPSAKREEFPFLADFRRTTIDDILCHARRDRFQRIGRMESWGLPGRAVRYVTARTQ